MTKSIKKWRKTTKNAFAVADLCIFIVVFSVLIYYSVSYNTNPAYFYADPASDYDEVPYILCEDAIFQPTESHVQFNDRWCQFFVGQDFYVKQTQPLLYWVIQNKWLLVIVTLLYAIAQIGIRRHLKMQEEK